MRDAFISSAALYRFSTSRGFIIATCLLRLRALRYLNQIIRTQPVRERGLYLSAGHFETVSRNAKCNRVSIIAQF
jgi:hypothetical protein